MEALKHQITYAIEQMTLQGVNLKASSIGKLDFQGKNDLGSHDGLNKEYKKLSIQLKQLQLLEKRTREQLQTMRDEERELMRDIQRFSNLDVSGTFFRQIHQNPRQFMNISVAPRRGHLKNRGTHLQFG
jgi:intraflagellar transport protein 74